MKLDPGERIILKQGGPISMLQVSVDTNDRQSFPSLSFPSPVLYLTNKKICVETWLPRFIFLGLHFTASDIRMEGIPPFLFGAFVDIPLGNITSIKKETAGLFVFLAVKYKTGPHLRTMTLNVGRKADTWLKKINEAKSQLR
jgi:hypothetical protein